MKHNTVKFLIGITSCGTISFLSKCWGGHVSDKSMTQESGFLKKIESGDIILADQLHCERGHCHPWWTVGNPSIHQRQETTFKKRWRCLNSLHMYKFTWRELLVYSRTNTHFLKDQYLFHCCRLKMIPLSLALIKFHGIYVYS